MLVLSIPRSAVLPFVSAICGLALLLSAGTFIIMPWFTHSFDRLNAIGVGHADVDVIFRHVGSLATVLLMVAPATAGAWLLRRSESRFTHVAWFGVLSVLALAVWAFWVGLVVHNTYLALFTRF